jgi:hypothetical protein
MLRLKPGVDLRLLEPQIVVALMVAQSIYTQYDAECVITSGRDGKHSDRSLHYLGRAVDLRTRMFTASAITALANELRDCLGPQYDVVVESDHIHLEWDPGKG